MTTQPTPEQASTPAVGDRYVNRLDARTVTITSLWTGDDGHTAVTYEWPSGIRCVNALSLDEFHRTYQPAAEQASATVTAGAALKCIRDQAAEWATLAPPYDWGDTPQDTALADVGRALLNLIDQVEEQQATAVGEQPRRRILTDDEYDAAHAAACAAAPHTDSFVVQDAMDAALAAIGILTPPPTPDQDACYAQFADPTGAWHQCTELDHDPVDGHSDGEWSWPDGDMYAVDDTPTP